MASSIAGELQAIYTEAGDELNELSCFGVSLFFAD
jgi:hypothetical protein